MLEPCIPFCYCSNGTLCAPLRQQSLRDESLEMLNGVSSAPYGALSRDVQSQDVEPMQLLARFNYAPIPLQGKGGSSVRVALLPRV